MVVVEVEEGKVGTAWSSRERGMRTASCVLVFCVVCKGVDGSRRVEVCGLSVK